MTERELLEQTRRRRLSLARAGTVLACVAAVGGVRHWLEEAEGFLAIVLVGVGAAALLALLLTSVAILRPRVRVGPFVPQFALLLGSVLLSLLAVEGVLNVVQASAPSEMAPSIPEELAFRRVDSGPDFYLLGVLHEHNAEGFRTHDFSPPDPETLRIVVLGDSLTFGQGLEREHRYTDVLERELGRGHRVEVLNLGKRGHQMEDLLQVAKRYLPRLQPDLVLYGHCLNDFLPKGKGQYQNNRRWQVPLPERVKDALTERTLIGALISERYDKLLMKLDIRRDFFADILLDFDGYATEFGENASRLNSLVRSRGLPPVVALVLNQFPRDPRGREISRLAERSMSEAGMDVIAADYIREYADKEIQLHLGRWDGHPNAEGNRLFADAFLRYFSSDPGAALLEPYRHDDEAAAR